ncbi:MAG: type II secretion system F family protein [Lachnospiraceae bacterium]|nr:type II secretion system F family protein [Lachnospiraceae bacterium]
MRMLMIHAAVCLGFAVLFVWSGGTFAAAASRINRLLLDPLDLSDASVRTALIIIFAANILGACALGSEWSSSTVRDGYLVREEYGGTSYTENLEVDVGGEKESVALSVPPRIRTEKEVSALLAAACADLPDIVLGGMPASHVDRDLLLVNKLGDEGITVSWMTGNPSVIDWDGKICRDVTPAGSDVRLSAELSLDGYTRELTMDVTVYPRNLTPAEKLRDDVERAVDAENASSTGDEKLLLPGQIDGRPVSWSMPDSSTGLMILIMGILSSVLFLFSRIQNRGIELDKKRQQLMCDYPNVISYLVLLLNAGMSMRMAFARLASDYRKSLDRGGQAKVGYEVIAYASAEMEKGVSEIDAYMHIGRNTPEIRYKTFSTLLVQNLRKGSRELTGILEREAAEAFEERKKQARIMGEQAGTKLMFPMLLMLGVVLVILMVPAYLSFQ